MENEFEGRIWKLPDNVDTDIIIPTQYLAMKTIEEMTAFAFSPLRKGLASQICPGDILVAGTNFGCGSSREQAPEVLVALGIRCIIAKSFARIFFRNGMNNGLLLLETPNLYDSSIEGYVVRVVLNESIIHNGIYYPISKIPENLLTIISDGGLVKSMVKRNKITRERRI